MTKKRRCLVFNKKWMLNNWLMRLSKMKPALKSNNLRNHSFNPNMMVEVLPDEECVVFKALRNIDAGETLSFDYTSTEEAVLAAPFVDVATGKEVGYRKQEP